MAILLKQSTAGQEIPLGYFVDSTDGDTEEGALTIANTDIKIWKNGATTLANKNSGGATHISNGVYYCTLDATDTNTLGPLVIWKNGATTLANKNSGGATSISSSGVYYCTLDATDTDTLGPMVIFVHESGALPVRVECMVVDAITYDIQTGAAYNTGTATAGAAGSITIETGLTDNTVNGSQIWTTGGTGPNQVRQITNYTSTSGLATVSPNWTTNPASGTTYVILPAAPAPTAAGSLARVDLREIAGATVSTTTAQLGVNVVEISEDSTAADNAEAAFDGTGYNVGGGSVVAASVTGAVGSVTGNVGGSVASVTGAVGSVTGAVGSVTGMAASDVGAIKAKTDSLTFTTANQVDANVQSVNDVLLQGAGTSVDKMRPA